MPPWCAFLLEVPLPPRDVSLSEGQQTQQLHEALFSIQRTNLRSPSVPSPSEPLWRQGKGLGRFLMQLLELIGRRSGVARLMLTVFHANEAAVALYRRLGWVGGWVAFLCCPLRWVAGVGLHVLHTHTGDSLDAVLALRSAARQHVPPSLV